MYLKNCSPPRDNETIVPHLVLCAKKKKESVFFTFDKSSPHRCLKVVLRSRDASNTFFLLFQQSELDKHAFQSLPGNPPRKR